jgi:hypothetical protein
MGGEEYVISTINVTQTVHFDTTLNKFVFVPGQKTLDEAPPFFVTIFSNGGHYIWDRMYQNQETYDWLLRQKK